MNSRASRLLRRYCTALPAVPNLLLDHEKAVIRVQGVDARSMLQGLTSNDVRLLSDHEEGEAFPMLYSAFMSSKGKMIADVFLHNINEETIAIEVHSDCAAALQRHLSVHKFRSKADISITDEYSIVVGSGCGGAKDCRLEQSAYDLPVLNRLCLTTPEAEEIAALKGEQASSVYTVYRMLAGLPEGPTEIPPLSALPLESGLDFMCGVSFNKGCYVGQELTARTHHRGLTRKRVLPVVISDKDIDPLTVLDRVTSSVMGGTSFEVVKQSFPLSTVEGKSKAGTLRSVVKIDDDLSLGFALLRLEHIDWYEPTLVTEDGRKLTPIPPLWWPEE